MMAQNDRVVVEGRTREMNRYELAKLICPSSGKSAGLRWTEQRLAISPFFRHHLNCGTVGTPMCGGGSGATFWAFAIPLGSTT